LLASFKLEMKVLCLAGAWCGDCVNQCPIFEHFAQANPRIVVRYFDRDRTRPGARALRQQSRAGGAVCQRGQFSGRLVRRYTLLSTGKSPPIWRAGLSRRAGRIGASLLEVVVRDWLDSLSACS
jgi:hypothetical protein